MNREIFMKKLETYKASSAPVDVKEKAIARLMDEFFNSDKNNKFKQILSEISLSSSELKASELY